MSISTLAVVRPLAITPAMLVSSDVPETDYPEWAAGTTYADKDRVIKAHKVWQGVGASNVGNDPETSPTKWQEVGATNRWKPFDRSVSSQVAQADSISYRIKPGQAVTSLCVLNIKGGTSIRVRVIDPAYGTVYDKTVSLARVPVAAAGGLADGRDVARVLAQGAQAAVLGTALIATPESFAHDYHKRRLVAARASDTVLTEDFHINWPPHAAVRVLASSVTRGERGDPFSAAARTTIGEEEGRPIYLFSTDSPLRSMTGDFEGMALYAGRGVDRIGDVEPAGERVRRIAEDAAQGLLPPAC